MKWNRRANYLPYNFIVSAGKHYQVSFLVEICLQCLRRGSRIEDLQELSRPVAFRLHLTMGLALAHDDCELPRGYSTSSQEQGLPIFRGLFMGYLRDGG